MKSWLVYAVLLVSIGLLSLPTRVASLQRGTVTIKVAPSAFVTVRREGFFGSGKTPFQTTLDYGSYSVVVMLAGYTPQLFSLDVHQPLATIEVELPENPNWKQLIDIPTGASARFDDTYSGSPLPVVKIDGGEDQTYSLAGGINPTATKLDMASNSIAWSAEQLASYHVAVWDVLGVGAQTRVYVSPSGRYVLLPQWVEAEKGIANLWLIDLHNGSEIRLPELIVGSAEQLLHNNVRWASNDSGFITSLFDGSQPRLFRISTPPLRVTTEVLLPLVKSAEPASILLVYVAANPDLDHILAAILVPGPAIKLALVDVGRDEVKLLPNSGWLLTTACWPSNNEVLLIHPSYGILKVNYLTLTIEAIMSSEELGGVTVHDARFSADCKDLFVLTDIGLSDSDVLTLRVPDSLRN